MDSVDIVGLIPFKLWGRISQRRELKTDVFVEGMDWSALTNSKEARGIFFDKATTYMVKLTSSHLLLKLLSMARCLAEFLLTEGDLRLYTVKIS